MKKIIFLIPLILVSCAPVQEEKQWETKYPDAPTMQSAEDAQTGILFKD